MHKKIQKTAFLAVGLVLSMTTGCSPRHDLSYFEDIQTTKEGVIPSSAPKIKLMPEDELKITVTSAEPRATAQFNLPLTNQPLSGTANMATEKIQTYIVNRAGDIDFPVLGKIHVNGMTTSELKDYLTRRISETVKDPLVRVELVNFRVKVLGEVMEPQIVEVKSERFTLLDALAAAGDLTAYGNRENIVVMRQNPDGSLSYGNLNLRDSSLASSPYFILQQNDVVYAYPNAVKQENSKYNQNNGFKLSVISTIVSATSVIASLVIALTVK